MNYARLSSVMSNKISMNALLAICAELQVSPGDLNLAHDPSQREFMLAVGFMMKLQVAIVGLSLAQWYEVCFQN
jgi:hypothetical protein